MNKETNDMSMLMTIAGASVSEKIAKSNIKIYLFILSLFFLFIVNTYFITLLYLNKEEPIDIITKNLNKPFKVKKVKNKVCKYYRLISDKEYYFTICE